MPAPEFSSNTKETLARRARFQCSNPDCRAQTVGPNSEPEKAIVIGEAAHIFGARPSSKRYDERMSDATRAAITNGIWLCRNCHGMIDRDADMFTSELLFAWRQLHEDRILSELGTPGEQIRNTVEMEKLEFLLIYPRIIQRVATDKPTGWEWRFVSELMRHLNKPELKRLQDLRSGHYFKPLPRVKVDDFFDWLITRYHVMENLLSPISGLMDRLTKSWGEPGEAGDLEEMHDVCILIRDCLAGIVDHEEVLRFTKIPGKGERIREILLDAIGSNVDRIADIPDRLDEIISLIGTDHGGSEEEPLVVNWTVKIQLPDGFSEQIKREMEIFQMDVYGN